MILIKKMEKDNIDNKDQIHNGLNNLCQKVITDSCFFKFKNYNLLKYLAIQDTIPFQTYFENQFIRIIEKDSLKKHLIFRREEIDFNIIDFFITKIHNEQVDNSKKQIENIKEIKHSREEKSRIQTNDSNNKSLKKNKTKNDSTKNNTSNISFNMAIIQQKLDAKKEEEIEELISQKENLLEQIINENNESKKNRLIYFVDTNNLSGEQFEKAGIKYIFELINCLSVKQDFYFYHDIKLNSDILNSILKKNKLNEINNAQLEFVISDLRIIDFINLLIYLYPNILDLNNLKQNPFTKGMDFNTLLQLRKKYKNSQKKLIFSVK